MSKVTDITNKMQQDNHIAKYTLTIDKSDVSYRRRDCMMERMISSGTISINDILFVKAAGCNTCTHTTGEHHGCHGQIHAASQSPTLTEFRCHSGEDEQPQHARTP